MSSHNTFRYERALIPPRVGESAAIISSDEIPEWRRRRRGEAYRHAHVPFRNSSSLTSSRPQRCATHLRGAATLNTFQRRDEFCKRVLHICIAPPRPSTKPFQGDYARVCANDCDTQTSTTTLAVQWCPRRERGRERLETGRPAGWPVGSKTASRGEKAVLCIASILRSSLRAINQAGRHDQPAMLFPNSNSSSRVSSPRER